MAKCDDGGNIFEFASRLFLCCLFVAVVGPVCHAAGVPVIRTGANVTAVTPDYDQPNCPVWNGDDSCVYFMEQNKMNLIRYTLGTGKTIAIGTQNKSFKFMVPVAAHGPSFVGGDGLKITLFSWDGVLGYIMDENRKKVITNPGEGFLCGAADVRHRLWIGSSFSGTEGRLYKVDSDGKVTVKLDNVGIPSAIAFQPSNEGNNFTRMYLADTTLNMILGYSFDIENGDIPASGSIAIFNFATKNVSCSAIAMAVDLDGNLWIACGGTNYIIQIDTVNSGENSKVLTTVTLPETESVTNVIFGGPRMEDLYVTTKRKLFKVTGTGTTGANALKLEVNWAEQ